jgi:metallo-beta-lactamase family protein
VLLTHGHLDHCGWLPRLVDQGLKVKYTVQVQQRNCQTNSDSGKIQEEEAERARRSILNTKSQNRFIIEQARKFFRILK